MNVNDKDIEDILEDLRWTTCAILNVLLMIIGATIGWFLAGVLQ